MTQVPAEYGYGYGDFDRGMGDSEKTFRDYLDIVLSRIRLVAIVFAIVLAITVIYTLLQIPLYTSEAVLEPEGFGGVGKESSLDRGERSFYEKSVGIIPNQIEIFSSSKSLAEAFKKRMNFDEFPELKQGKTLISKKMAGWFSGLSAIFVGKSNPDSSQDDATTKNNGQAVINVPVLATAKISKKSGLITVSLIAESPRLAKKMLETYLDVYLGRNLENRRAESLEAADWLKKELDEVNEKLTQSQSALVSFTINNGIVDSRDGGIGQVMAMVNKTVESRIKSQESQTKLRLLEKEIQKRESEDFIPTGEKNEYIGKLKQDVAMMESEYAQMRVVYSENYPKLVMMKKKIKFLKDRILAMEKDSISASKELAEKEDQAVKQSFDVASIEASRVQVLESQYMTLKKEVDTNQEFQKLLLKEYKQMHIKARTIGNNLRMIDPPTQPTKPSWPKTKLNLLIGCLLGLVGGIASAFVANAFDDTFKHHSEIEKELGLKKLGVVPDVVKAAHLHNIDESSRDYEFIAHDKPKSPLSDAVKNIQTSILLSNMEDPVKSMMVSSTLPSEGKTLIAVSLATTLTRAGSKRVVLVDADMRKPRLYKALGLSETGSGLSDFLNGSNLPLENILHPHRVPGFFYITSGPIPPDPISLLTGERMKSLLDELNEKFDYVVIDCPPILGFSDSPILSTYVDGVVLVIQPGKVMKAQLKEAVHTILSLDGARILGVVMNKANVGDGYGYKYRYGGYLGYLRYGRYGGYGKYGGDYYSGNYKYYSDKT
jgi:capsular exopolysaccharide synthesis family protein